MSRRVVITGVGLVTPLGIGLEANWSAVVEGRSGIGPITRFDASGFPCRIAGEVPEFDPLRFFSPQELKRTELFIQYAIGAAEMAVEHAGLRIDADVADRVGVNVGSGIGGLPGIESQHRTLVERGPRRISPFFIPRIIVNMASGQISIRLGARGPNTAPCTACATGNHAIGDSLHIIARDEADVMLAGGAESVITPLGVAGFAAMRALSTRNDEPERASRPFDAGRDGFVIGEGAGVLVLESLEHARGRGAPVLAELVGYGMSADAHHISAPPEDGDGPYRAMRAALRSASIAAEQLGYVNAHATSTPAGDPSEAVALRRLYGGSARPPVPVSSTKSMMGHLLGAAGGVEAAITVLALERGVLPPTINQDEPDPACDLDTVPGGARERRIDYAMTNSFGFGGTNATLVFKRFDG